MNLHLPQFKKQINIKMRIVKNDFKKFNKNYQINFLKIILI